MDPSRFDSLSRALASGASRRGALAALLAALLPAAGLATPGGGAGRDQPVDAERGDPGADGRGDGPAAERCVANGQRCGKGSGKKGKPDKPCKKCCSKYATPKSQGPQRCSCKPNSTACTNNAQCCGGRCTGGQCGPCAPGLTSCQPDGCVDLQTSDAHCGSCPNACAATQVCQGGSCACTAASCPDGCCAGATCAPGTTDNACGTGGTACAVCADGQDCAGGTCTCNAASCPGGCCDGGGTCVSPPTARQCGTGGAACTACTGDCDTGTGTCCLPFRAACNADPDCCRQDCTFGFCS